MTLENEQYLRNEIVGHFFGEFREAIVRKKGRIEPESAYFFDDEKGMILQLRTGSYNQYFNFYIKISLEHERIPAFFTKSIEENLLFFNYCRN